MWSMRLVQAIKLLHGRSCVSQSIIHTHQTAFGALFCCLTREPAYSLAPHLEGACHCASSSSVTQETTYSRQL